MKKKVNLIIDGNLIARKSFYKFKNQVYNDYTTLVKL